MRTMRLVSEGTSRDLQQPQQPPIAETVTWADSRKMPERREAAAAAQLSSAAAAAVLVCRSARVGLQRHRKKASRHES